MSDKLIEKITEKYPFLSICQSADNEYIGIIMNRDKNTLVMYDFDMIKDQQLKKYFLTLGEIWWWESNRNIPINLFLKQEWAIFKEYKRIFMNKNVKILCGPYTNLNEIASQYKKRKAIILVRKVE